MSTNSKEYMKEYNKKNREKLNEKKRQYYQENKEKILEYQKKRYCEKSEELKQKSHDYYHNNKDKVQDYQERNRDRILQKKKDRKNSLVIFDRWYKKLEKYYDCRRDPDNNELLQLKCKYCGTFFTPTVGQVETRLFAINSTNFGECELYCSKGCKQACPTFGQMKYPKGHLPATSREVQAELRKIVLERDNWICQKCGSNKEIDPDVELHCHHIFPKVNEPIQEADKSNCITLCVECHRKVHNLPGCRLNELRC